MAEPDLRSVQRLPRADAVDSPALSEQDDAAVDELPHIEPEDVQIVRHVATGGFATVFRAKLRGEKDVAVKVVPKVPGELDFRIQSFVHEWRLMRRLSHPCIVRAYGVALLPPKVFQRLRYVSEELRTYGGYGLVQELCEEGSVAGLITQQEINPHMHVYSMQEALGWCQDIAKALAHMHASPMIHRDLKLDNILLKRSGRRRVAKLMDFGLSVRIVADRALAASHRIRGSDPSSKAIQDALFMEGSMHGQGYLALAPEGSGRGSVRAGRAYERTGDSDALVLLMGREPSTAQSPAGATASDEARPPLEPRAGNDLPNLLHDLGSLSPSAGGANDHQRGLAPQPTGTPGSKQAAGGSPPGKAEASPRRATMPTADGLRGPPAREGSSKGARRFAARRASQFQPVAESGPMVDGHHKGSLYSSDSGSLAAVAGNLPPGSEPSASMRHYAAGIRQNQLAASLATNQEPASQQGSAVPLGGWRPPKRAATILRTVSSLMGMPPTDVQAPQWVMTGQTGSLIYMAPEVMKGLPYNSAADIFSFGVVMYQLFSGKHICGQMQRPGEAEQYAERVSNGFRLDMPKRFPPSLRAVIVGTWEQAISERPTAAQLLRQLEELEEAPDFQRFAGMSGGCCGFCFRG